MFVALLHPLVPRIRKSALLSALLDGINMAAVGLMAAVAVSIGQAAIVDGVTLGLALVTALLLIRWKVNTTALILGGGALGVLAQLVSGG